MKKEELKKLSVNDLKRRMSELNLTLVKETGQKRLRSSGYDRSWHPNFKEMRKELARIHTILREK